MRNLYLGIFFAESIQAKLTLKGSFHAVQSYVMASVDFLYNENPPTWVGTLGTEGQRQTNYASHPREAAFFIFIRGGKAVRAGPGPKVLWEVVVEITDAGRWRIFPSLPAHAKIVEMKIGGVAIYRVKVQLVSVIYPVPGQWRNEEYLTHPCKVRFCAEAGSYNAVVSNTPVRGSNTTGPHKKH
ncbi:hypothetical protein TNCV_2924851 [Trichonephila clavipes]|nr:hypothetical protein TNCV_2924851 [Trichonephila clavipes]